jgi:hypothetical protein
MLERLRTVRHIQFDPLWTTFSFSLVFISFFFLSLLQIQTMIAFSKQAFIPALYIKQQSKKAHGRTIQGDEVTLLQRRSQDNWIIQNTRY